MENNLSARYFGRSMSLGGYVFNEVEIHKLVWTERMLLSLKIAIIYLHTMEGFRLITSRQP